MHRADRETVHQAWEHAARTFQLATGQPERIEDRATAATLSGVLRDPSDCGQVVRSGRCGDCGYLLSSPGHEISCG